jgi:hypothetical protein
MQLQCQSSMVSRVSSLPAAALRRAGRSGLHRACRCRSSDLCAASGPVFRDRRGVFSVCRQRLLLPSWRRVPGQSVHLHECAPVRALRPMVIAGCAAPATRSARQLAGQEARCTHQCAGQCAAGLSSAVRRTTASSAAMVMMPGRPKRASQNTGVMMSLTSRFAIASTVRRTAWALGAGRHGVRCQHVHCFRGRLDIVAHQCSSHRAGAYTGGILLDERHRQQRFPAPRIAQRAQPRRERQGQCQRGASLRAQ